jgi:rhamnogalacturonyl hydrolase YesR
MSLSDKQLIRSLDGVQHWVETHDYRGYDPGDGSTSWLRHFTFGNSFAKRVLQQVIWKSPVNIRPLVGIRPGDSTKGRGFIAWAYLLRYKVTGEAEYLEKARLCLAWLEEHVATGYPGMSWGNHFDFTTRSGTMPAGEPTIVWSGLIGQAFLEAYEQTGEGHYLEICQQICQWILQLPRHETSSGTCLSYVAYGDSWIHNSNMLGAAMLARTWKHTGDAAYLEVAREAMRYSCTRQLPDGAWYYAEAEKYHWIDNFHTGYNLDSLKRFIDATGEDEFRDSLESGYDYFKRTFFEPSGMPRYYHNKTQPVDIQCAAQAIDTLAFFSEDDPEALPLAERVASWTISHLQDTTGYFYFRHYGVVRAKTPYLHWGQGTMFKALAHLQDRMRETSPASGGPVDTTDAPSFESSPAS